MNGLTCTLFPGVQQSVTRWVRGVRGSISVEFVLGTIIILTVTVGGMDLYRIADTRSVASDVATMMAGYVAGESAPTAAFVEDLAGFLHREEIRWPSEVTFAISAIRRDSPTDPQPIVAWARTIGVNSDSSLATSATTCSRAGAVADEVPVFPAGLQMEPGERVVMVEVCVKMLPEAFLSRGLVPANLLPSVLYQRRIAPVGGDAALAEPS